MKKLFALFWLGVVIIVVGVSFHNGGRDSIMSLLQEHDEASDLIRQLGQGNDEALYELEDHAQRGGIPYALSLASYNSMQGDYPARDKTIMTLLKKANSLESLFILQEFAYLYDNHALSKLLGEMMDKDGRIPPYVYVSVEKTSFTPEQINVLAQCYQRLSMVYGKPVSLNWNLFIQNGWENITGREGVCFSFAPKKSMSTLASRH
jgi:hypothetical protein